MVTISYTPRKTSKDLKIVKILLIQTSFLGDTILSTPLISGIHSIYPNAEVWMMTTPAAAELVRRDSLLAGVMFFDKGNSDSGIGGLRRKAAQIRAMGFDCVYSLHRSWRTALLVWLSGIPKRVGFVESSFPFVYQTRIARAGYSHDVERNLAILTSDNPLNFFDGKLRLFAPRVEEVSTQIRDYLSGPKPFVFVPGSVWATKMWSWRHYHETAKQLVAQGHRVLLLGGTNEEGVCAKVANGSGAINLAGKTDLGSLMALIKHARLVVCNDSMALHMASAFKVPTVAIFCATVPEFGFGPWQNRAEVLGVQGLGCRPCSRHGTMRCPTGTNRCMSEIEPKAVLESISRLLSESV